MTQIHAIKQKNNKSIIEGFGLLFGAPLVLFLINYALEFFGINFRIVPHFLVIFALIGLAWVWRNGILAFHPEIMLDDKLFQYFNAFGYKKIPVENIKMVVHDKITQNIHLVGQDSKSLTYFNLDDYEFLDEQAIFNFFKTNQIPVSEKKHA